MPEVVVASYNVHGGVDGWGRPYDVVEACKRIDADVLVLQESWAPDGGQSVADKVADALGYTAFELGLARATLFGPSPDAGRRWGPRLWERRVHGLRLNSRRVGRRAQRYARRWSRSPEVARGTWGIAVLSRLPVLRTEVLDLGQLRSDPAHRRAVVLEVSVDGSRLRVVGAHLSHLSQGSPVHISRLRRALRAMEFADATLGSDATGGDHATGNTSKSGKTPVEHGVPDEQDHRVARETHGAPSTAITGAVLAGDMNLWGPPLSALFPGWARAVRGRSWPTWWVRPIAQSDHVLVSRGVTVDHGDVVRVMGSDHFPVRARLVIE